MSSCQNRAVPVARMKHLKIPQIKLFICGIFQRLVLAQRYWCRTSNFVAQMRNYHVITYMQLCITHWSATLSQKSVRSIFVTTTAPLGKGAARLMLQSCVTLHVTLAICFCAIKLYDESQVWHRRRRRRRRRSEVTSAGQCLYARILQFQHTLLILILISNNNSDFRFHEFRL